MKNIYLLVLTFLCSSAFAQQPVVRIATVNPSSQNLLGINPQGAALLHNHCATDALRKNMAEKYADDIHSEPTMNQHILQYVQPLSGELLYIPVVIHIIHNNGVENISDQMVLQGIQDLNDAFANTGNYYTPSGMDMGIRFCLAQQDPDGLPTNGITRNVSTLTNVTADNGQDLQLKNIIRWDPTRYVNIWLVSEITSISMGAGVAGYAHLPNAHGTVEDGIVNEARWFGNSTDDSKVHIHEMGHYLGLYHTFEGGCANNNCQTDGDHVCDTPPDGTSAPSPCGSFSNTCSTDDDDLSTNNPFRPAGLGGIGDQDDPMEDYMDYGLSSCQKSFTDGQGERMRDALQSIRGSLLESEVCQTSCGIGIVGIDTANVINVTAGQSIQIQSHYTATVPVTFQWVFNGQVISTQETLSHTFTNAAIGQHYLYMSWINAADDCSLRDSILIHVKCNPPAVLSFSPYIIEPGIPVTFNGSNPLATSYAWYLNSQLVGTSASFTHTFANGGENYIYLVTGNGQCYDTSAVQYLGVGACGSGENNHWIMGGGSGNHIDFSSGSPVVTAVEDNGANELGTIEGVATVSDRNGNLLFYSDGVKLFNRNHEAFFTGMGAGSSSAQGVLIVPDPANSQSYYVFTAENFGGVSYTTFRGLSYLKVDMTMNGGLGGVSSQYITLLNKTSEKLTSTRHCNGTDIWVVAHGFNDNKFYSYLITAAGLQTPVISAVGTSQYSGTNAVGSQAVGYHKISPQGDKLLSSTTYMAFAELFDFDNSTGVISNPCLFPPGNWVYSAEFSPDGSKLYYGKEGDKKIYCMDVSSGNSQMMNASIVSVGTTSTDVFLGSLQIGPDGKIYISRYDNYVDVINHPNNSAATCGFETEVLYLPNSGRYGLNNIFISPRYTGPQIIGPPNVCVGQNNIKYKVGCGNNTWEYRGHNAYTLISTKEVSINFSTVGIDTLICHRSNTCSGPASDTLYIHVGGNMANLGPNISMCSSGSTVLSPGTGYITRLWSTGAATPTLTVSQAGTYWVQVTGLGGCTDRDTVIVTTFNSTFNVPDEAIIQVCGNPNVASYILDAAQGNFTHIWNSTLSTGNSQTAFLTNAITRVPITYYNSLGCADKDTFVIQKVSSFPPINIGNDTLICPGQLVVLHRNTSYPYQNYEWSDGSNGQTSTVYQAGTYWLSYEDPICHNVQTDYITVGYPPVPAITLPNYSPTVCQNSNYQLDAGTGYTNFIWNDGSTGRYHTVMQPGLYWVEAQAVCQTVRDSVTVNFYNDAIYNPNFPDTINVCSNSLPYSLHGNNTGALQNYQWSTGAVNLINLIVTQEGTYSLTADYVCGTISDTTYIRILQQPATLLPANQQFCNSESQFVLHGPPNAINTWSTGVVADSITVTQTDTYQISSLGQNGCTTIDDIYVSFSNIYIDEINDTVICAGQTLSIPINTNAPLLYAPAGTFTPPFIVSDTGSYFIFAFENGCFASTSFHVDLGGSAAFDIHMADTLFACSDELPVELSAGDMFTHYQWNTGAQTSSISVTQNGMYSVVATYACGESKDSTYLLSVSSPIVSLSLLADTLCPGESVVLHANPLYNNLWSTGSNANSITISQAGNYWLQSSNSGCSASDTVSVVNSALFIQSIPDDGFCAPENIIVEAITNGEEILWSTGQTSSTITLNQPGNYWVESSLGSCSITETFTLTQWPIPVFNLGSDIAVTNGPVTIGINDIFESYTWNVSGNTSTISVNAPGTYILTATNADGCTYSDTIRVYFTASISENGTDDMYLYIPQVISPSHGSLLAQYSGIQLKSVTVYDATGKTISTANNFPTVWNGNTGSGATAATGMYYYTLYYSTTSGKPGVYHGKVLLVEF